MAATTNLRPHRFGSTDGFRCDLAFMTKNGLAKQGLAAGGVVKNRLYLVLYTGAKLPTTRRIGTTQQGSFSRFA